MNSSALQRHERTSLTSVDILFVATLLAIVWSILSSKEFSADGAWYFIDILQNKVFTHIDWHRQFANYLMQWPLVAALHLGVSNPRLLRLSFGVGAILAYPVAYLIVRWQARRLEKPGLLYGYAIGTIIVTLASDFILEGEHQLLLPLSWPIIAFLMCPRRFKAFEWTIPVALSFALIRVYEPALFVFLALSAILGTNGRRDLCGGSMRKDSVAWLALGVCVLLWLAGMAIALDSILHPRDPANRGAFAGAVFHIAANPVLRMAAISIGLFTAGLRYPKARIPLVAVAFLITCIVWHMRFAVFSAQISFDSRVMVLALPALMCFTAWVRPISTTSIRIDIWFCAIFLFPVMVNVEGTTVWRDFAGKVVGFATSEAHGRLIPASVHQLNQHPASWIWTFPSLSIVLGAPHVSAILENSPSSTYEPFDPAGQLPLPSFANYASSVTAYGPTPNSKRVR